MDNELYCYSNLANFLPLVWAHIVRGHLAQNWQLCKKQSFQFFIGRPLEISVVNIRGPVVQR